MKKIILITPLILLTSICVFFCHSNNFCNHGNCLLEYQHLTKPVSRLKVTVNTNLAFAQQPKKQPRTLSASAAKAINQAAELIEEGDLKMALCRLAKRHP